MFPMCSWGQMRWCDCDWYDRWSALTVMPMICLIRWQAIVNSCVHQELWVLYLTSWINNWHSSW